MVVRRTLEMAQREVQDDEWKEWLPEAFRLVSEWDASKTRRMLTITESSDLAERIAHAMQLAFRRGLHET